MLVLAKRHGPEQDDGALRAGRLIRQGAFTRRNLSDIFEWKTKGRGRSRLAANSEDEIEDALSLAVGAKTERTAIAVLLGLQGVAAPVGSAVLSMVDPDRYTVMDFHALESLGKTAGARAICVE